jgi:microcystin-dependent protein
MALESATHIADLNAANPLSTDTVSQADDHLRLIKQVLKTTFPNLNAPVTSTPAQLNNPVPVGVIVMWSGAVNAVPGGWALCNGSNGTPDLRDRFVVGAGSTYAVGAIGGANTVTLTSGQMPSHTHTLSGTTGDQSASHTHTFSTTTSAAGAHNHDWAAGEYTTPGNYDYGTNLVGNNLFSTDGARGYSMTTSTVENHTHTVSGTTQTASSGHTHTFSGTTTVTGGGEAHENRPPYFALAYIMKV